MEYRDGKGLMRNAAVRPFVFVTGLFCWSIVAFVLCFAFTAYGAETSGEPVLEVEDLDGPVQTTWDDMLSRILDDSTVKSGANASAPRVIDEPLGEFPPKTPGPLENQQGHKGDVPKRIASPDDVPAGPAASAPQSVDTNFAGISLQDQFNAFGVGSIPPDTMGAIGPNHFMEILNRSVAIYTRTGTQLGHVALDTFFGAGLPSWPYPQNGAFDPRVLYDCRSGRWIAVALERGAVSGEDNGIVMAVSATNDPTGGWTLYWIGVGVPTSGPTSYFTDYETLGTDDNGIYSGMRIFPSSGSSWAQILMIRKAEALAGGAISAWVSAAPITDMFSSPQAAHNHDGVDPLGRAWLVSSSDTTYANVHYRTVTWAGSPITPSLSTTTVLTTPGYGGAPPNALASGSTTDIDVGDDRLQMAVIRDDRLWTCRNVGTDASGGDTAANRTACEWLELNVSGTPATLVQSGRVFDGAASDPIFYYYPSIMVSGQGHVAMGFSGSNSAQFVAAYTCGRLATDALGTMRAITQVKSGEASYTRLDSNSRNRWGDYSYTTLDPNDDMTIWTVQEYAEDVGANIWGTWIARLLAPAPTLVNPGILTNRNQVGFTINLVGTNFYDPSIACAPNHLDVQFLGGSGITVTNITYNNPSSVDVTIDISATASLGPRDIVLTNPDGQSATATAGLTIAGFELRRAVLGFRPSGDYFSVNGVYHYLPTTINVSALAVTVDVGTYHEVIPAGSFAMSRRRYIYNGGAGIRRMIIDPRRGRIYILGRNLSLAGTTATFTVGITIGTFTDSNTVTGRQLRNRIVYAP